MGKGTDMARVANPIHAQAIDDFKDQLLLAMVKRAGGTVEISVAAVDDTGGWVLELAVRDGIFYLQAKRKE